MKKKLLSVLMAVIMLFGLLSAPLYVFADDVEEEGESVEKPFRCGDVLGNGSISISSALEILKYLAKIPTEISTNARALKAATAFSRNETPTINDALEILKYLAKLQTYFSTVDCYCDWCEFDDSFSTETSSDITEPNPDTSDNPEVSVSNPTDSSSNNTGISSVTTVSATTSAPNSTTTSPTNNTVTTSSSSSVSTGTTSTTTTNSSATTNTSTTTSATTTTNGNTSVTTTPNVSVTTSSTVSATVSVSTTTASTTSTRTTVSTTTNSSVTTTSTSVSTASVTTSATTTTTDEEDKPDKLKVSFSHSAGFYDAAISLELTSIEGATIYYTLDGSVPTPGKSGTVRYTAPININAPRPGASISTWDNSTVSKTSITNVNAIAVKDGETTAVKCRSFVMGTDVFTRFSADTLIFSLTSDPDNLYGHNNGILVEGIDREKWQAENPRQVANNFSPANYNRTGRSAERPVHVEVFDNTGNLHISQNAGIRVKGGWTRGYVQKTLELYARKEYDDTNAFEFSFFDDQEHSKDGQIINSYRRFRLRNGGTDRADANIRDELSHTLYKQAGFEYSQTHVPAAVFINGKYYGFSWVKSPRTENHWATKYGGKAGNYTMIDDSEEGKEGCDADGVDGMDDACKALGYCR
ncbi:MAG: CotH kinase family protein, partial [Oscillospiraceae bacterium]|nr:CotH kinase family protein [Oscillospiraceae bacterium]